MSAPVKTLPESALGRQRSESDAAAGVPCEPEPGVAGGTPEQPPGAEASVDPAGAEASAIGECVAEPSVTRPTSRHYLDIALYRAWADMRSNSVRLYLGAAWWILEPLVYVMAYYIAFAWIMRRGGGLGVGTLLTGIVVWKWFASSLTTGASSIVAGSGLIRQVWLPKFLLPLTTSITATFRFICVLPVLLGFLALGGGSGPALTWALLPLAMLLNFALNLGIATCLGAIVPFMQDLRIAIENSLLLLMFVSGVFFDLRASGELRGLLMLYMNPAASMIDIYRAILFRHELPDPLTMLSVLAAALVLLTVGVYLLRRYDGEYAKVV